jgi:hypothetical protein
MRCKVFVRETASGTCPVDKTLDTLTERSQDRIMGADITIGIDPGVTGAIACFFRGQLADIQDIPVIVTVKKAKGANIRHLIGGSATRKRRDIDVPAMTTLIKGFLVRGLSTEIISEKVGIRPGQGILSQTRLLRTMHTIEGIAAALDIPYKDVTPQVWKKATGTPAEKEAARKHAIKLFPSMAKILQRKGDHNRAEAALIGWYGVGTRRET